MGKKDNEDAILLPEDKFREILILENDIEKRILHAEDHETNVVNMIGNNEEFERLPSGIILFKGKTYIPPSLREIVISQHHDAITAGHPGVKRT